METTHGEEKENGGQNRSLQDPKSLGLIIRGIVHSFRNVIGLISGYAELSLRDASPESRTYAYLKKIIEGANAMTELSEKMRVLGQQTNLDLQLIPIHPIIEEAIHEFKASLSSPVEIKQDLDAACPAILADAGLIKHVVINLCSNAHQAIADDDGVIEVSFKNCKIDASFAETHRGLKEGAYVKLTVKDTGSGMSAETLSRIYEPFFTARKEGKSAGLGLSLVQKIVMEHRGEIVVESKLGEGSCFDVYFPTTEKM